MNSKIPEKFDKNCTRITSNNYFTSTVECAIKVTVSRRKYSCLLSIQQIKIKNKYKRWQKGTECRTIWKEDTLKFYESIKFESE